MSSEPKKMGFAAMSRERLREIASAGGIARRDAYKQARERKQAAKTQVPATQPPTLH